jgi:hypothetical protein
MTPIQEPHDGLLACLERYLDQIRQDCVNCLRRIGPRAAELATMIWSQNPPREAFHSVRKLLQFSRSYPADTFDAACRRACYYRIYTLETVQAVLQLQLYLRPLVRTTDIYGQGLFFPDQKVPKATTSQGPHPPSRRRSDPRSTPTFQSGVSS